MIDAGRVSILIPAYNEAAAIGAVIAGVLRVLPGAELLVVDDGSSDGTSEAAAAAGARVVRHPYNKGNGAAVKTGIREARGEIVLLMDADGQHDPEDIPRLLAPMADHDMVIGARAARDQTFVRAAGNAVFQALASWLTGRAIPDLTSGFRAVRRDRMREILHLLPNGFSYPTTSCLSFLKAGLSVTFVPVRAHARVGVSKIRVARDGVRFLLIIFKTVTLYSPLKVFFPIAASAFVFGVVYAVWNVFFFQKIPMGAALLIQLAVVVFLFGLISEQIAASADRK